MAEELEPFSDMSENKLGLLGVPGSAGAAV